MPVPVISVAQMREWEKVTWNSGQTEAAVIVRVGERVAQRAQAMTRPGERLLLLAGKGHNGNDVRAMKPHLKDRDVALLNISDPVIGIAELSQALARKPALIVDGLFGIGLSRVLSHDWLHLVARINHAHAPVLSVDVPSGLNADTGEVSTAAIRAAVTVTVGAPKRGLLTGEAAPYVGRLEVAEDVGLVPCPFRSDLQWTVPRDFDCFPPARPVASHKGTYGHVAIVAGSLGFHGASILAASGAQRARPGLITLFTQENTYIPVAAHTQAVMVQPWRDDLSFEGFSAALFGPGLAAGDLPGSLQENLVKLWQEWEQPLVVDASALRWLPAAANPGPACRVITPHPGEAARLLGCTCGEIQRDRATILRELSRRYGNCWVVLKGHQTLVGRAQGDLFANSSGNSGLAQGGSGDLLAGLIAGWLAQPALRGDPLMALRYAVWEHGAAADRLGDRRENWIIEELAEELGRKRGSDLE